MSDRMETSFEVTAQDLAGRLGKLRVRGREVRTPELMPVINPNLLDAKDAITPREMSEAFGFGMIITNSYIIRKTDKLRTSALEKGLHAMLEFEGPIMTDSGTFQSYIYGRPGKEEIAVTPEEIVRFQDAIGSDIGTILDRFTPPDASEEAARSDLAITLERARSSMEWRGGMELAVPVQGGTDLGLRAGSASAVRELGVRYAPIGGVVPLLEQYRYSELVDVVVSSKTGLGPAIPAHLFGAGHPMVLPLAVALGCDLFDSASYAKFASDGRFMTAHRTYHIEEMDDLPCSCPVCSRHDASDIGSMEAGARVHALSRHNLWTLRSVMASIRTAIAEGTLWELVETSASCNPAMHSAVRHLRAHTAYLERHAPRSTRRFMCTSDLSIARPEFLRTRRDLAERLPARVYGYVLADHRKAHQPWSERRACEAISGGDMVAVATPLGIAPYEVFEMYPLSQLVSSDPSELPPELSTLRANALSSLGTGVRDLSSFVGGTADVDLVDSIRIALMVRMQFGLHQGVPADAMLLGEWKGASDLPARLRIVRSRRTGKVRNVHLISSDGTTPHILSLRAEDGLFTLKWHGALRLHSGSRGTWQRVIVEDGTGDFNAKGFNVFNKFVLDCDPAIRPGDEVMVVGRDDRLHAVGRAVVDAATMVSSRNGTAVKVREGREKAEPPSSTA